MNRLSVFSAGGWVDVGEIRDIQITSAPRWPKHVSNSNCWCKPRLEYVDFFTGNEVWTHRNPMEGEFDA